MNRFGVLSPAVAVDPTTMSLVETAYTNSAHNTEVAERPRAPLATWAVSTAPVGGLVRSYDGRPFFTRLNGSDAHVRPLLAVFTRVPSGGSLSVAAPIGELIVEANEEQRVLDIGDAIPVGTRLIYRPDDGAHDPWLEGRVGEYKGIDMWTSEGEPYDWFGYRVETEGGEASENEAVVALSVRPETNAAHLDWPSKVGGRARPAIKRRIKCLGIMLWCCSRLRSCVRIRCFNRRGKRSYNNALVAV